MSKRKKADAQPAEGQVPWPWLLWLPWPFFFSLLAIPGDEANMMPPGHGVCR